MNLTSYKNGSNSELWQNSWLLKARSLVAGSQKKNDYANSLLHIAASGIHQTRFLDRNIDQYVVYASRSNMLPVHSSTDGWAQSPQGTKVVALLHKFCNNYDNCLGSYLQLCSIIRYVLRGVWLPALR
mmetsp:Transcript_22251/g.50954  ORF Transcript_22251/g.50954 Transcript_22251/m.50954 type:complete len:128 (-) Transcript_22251:56-439(-)